MRHEASQMPLSGRGSDTRRNSGDRQGDGRSGEAQVVPAGGSSTGWVAGLMRRLTTALVLIPIVIALVFFGGWVAFVGTALALIVGTLELRDMLAHKGWHPPFYLSTALGLIFLLAAVLPPPVRVPLIAGGISALLLVSFTWLMFTRPTLDRTIIDWAFTMAVPFYLAWPLSFFLLLRGNEIGAGSRGFWWLLTVFFTVWANDTAAFVAGHFFGRRKLAPHISPAKTWEGFVGGVLLALVAAFVFTRPLGVPWYQALILGAVVAVAATVGDLAESFLKRGTGVKDSGTIVPGHGGILDRMDSLLFAVIVVFFYAAAFEGFTRFLS